MSAAAPDTTADTLLGGRVSLTQPASGYRAAIDPVLLAAAVEARPGERVLDLGAGVGAVSLCLAARVPGVDVTGLELQPELAGLAALNAARSGLADRVRVLAGDLRDPPPGVLPGGFDHVVANPPYLEAGAHTPPPDPSRAAAHGEGAADLAAWIDGCHRLLRPRGTVLMVHRADRFDDVVALLHGRFGAITLFPLWPRAGAAARRVLVRARRDVRSPARVAAGLVLHGPDGAFTPAVREILVDGAALPLS